MFESARKDACMGVKSFCDTPNLFIILALARHVVAPDVLVLPLDLHC